MQVAVNDLLMLVAFAPIVLLLLGLSEITVPWDTLLLSVALYIVIPLLAGAACRKILVARRGRAWFERSFIPRVGKATPIGLVLTLVLLFCFQGETILANPLHIAGSRCRSRSRRS